MQSSASAAAGAIERADESALLVVAPEPARYLRGWLRLTPALRSEESLRDGGREPPVLVRVTEQFGAGHVIYRRSADALRDRWQRPGVGITCAADPSLLR